jgi:ribosomal protein L29
MKTEKTIELNATDKAYMAEKIATLKQELINLKIKYNNISNHNLQKVSEHQTAIEA